MIILRTSSGQIEFVEVNFSDGDLQQMTSVHLLNDTHLCLYSIMLFNVISPSFCRLVVYHDYHEEQSYKESHANKIPEKCMQKLKVRSSQRRFLISKKIPG